MNPPPEPLSRHLNAFLGDIRAQLGLGNAPAVDEEEAPRSGTSTSAIRGFLKLYEKLDVRKLAVLLDARGSAQDEEKTQEEVVEDVVQRLMAAKQAGRQLRHAAPVETQLARQSDAAESEEQAEASRGLLEGEWTIASDVSFVIEEVSPTPT